jgi:hypothetical protein
MGGSVDLRAARCDRFREETRRTTAHVHPSGWTGGRTADQLPNADEAAVPVGTAASLRRRERWLDGDGLCGQMGRTFSACGPFWPCVTSNSTRWFSSSDL